MNKAEFQRAFDIAKDTSKSLEHVDFSALCDFGKPEFRPVVVPIEAVARMIRWQAIRMDGSVDGEALTECRNVFRRKVTVVG